jgi:hypothetical protein
MRTKIVAVLAGCVALVGFAGIASAASISLEWDGSGSNSISGTAVGAHTVDIIVGTGGSLSLSALSIQASGGVTFTDLPDGIIGGLECGGAFCIVGSSYYSPLNAGVGSASATQITTIEAALTLGPGTDVGQYTLAQAIVNVTGAGGVSVFFVTGIDGISDANFNDITGDTSIFNAVVTPEPGTAALLGLGLGALAIAGRRR